DFNLDGTPNFGYKNREKGGYFPTPPYDQTVEVRDAMVGALQEVGFQIERFHREVGSGGQQEINYRFNTMLHAADDIQTFKYVIKNTAVAFNKTATFMPRSEERRVGKECSSQASRWKDGKPTINDVAGFAGSYGL